MMFSSQSSIFNKMGRWIESNYICSGLEKSPFGAKSDFDLWAFKVHFRGHRFWVPWPGQ